MNDSVTWLLEQSAALERIREERAAEDCAYLVFCKSEEEGDSEAVQKAFFGNKWQELRDRWDLEHIFPCRECGEILEDEEIAKQDEDHAHNYICDRCNASLPPEFVAADYRR